MNLSQSCKKSSGHAMKRLLSRVARSSLLCQCGGRGSVHSCAVDPGSSLVNVCQRSTFVPLFFRQSIQCCRVSPCEWHPKHTPPEKTSSVILNTEDNAHWINGQKHVLLFDIKNVCSFNRHLLILWIVVIMLFCCLLLAAIAYFVVFFPLIVCVVIYRLKSFPLLLQTRVKLLKACWYRPEFCWKDWHL